jgi:hypothetical protein
MEMEIVGVVSVQKEAFKLSYNELQEVARNINAELIKRDIGPTVRLWRVSDPFYIHGWYKIEDYLKALKKLNDTAEILWAGWSGDDKNSELVPYKLKIDVIEVREDELSEYDL